MLFNTLTLKSCAVFELKLMLNNSLLGLGKILKLVKPISSTETVLQIYSQSIIEA